MSFILFKELSINVNNFTCSSNVTWYVNLTGPNCNNWSSFWFTVEACSEQCNCSDFFNESELEDWIDNSSTLDLIFGNFSFNSEFALFFLWFFMVLMVFKSSDPTIVAGCGLIQAFVGVNIWINYDIFGSEFVWFVAILVVLSVAVKRIVDARSVR